MIFDVFYSNDWQLIFPGNLLDRFKNEPFKFALFVNVTFQVPDNTIR